MRRWMLLAAKLYPRGWRERYSEEFDALIEDYRPSWREVADLMRGAVKMQVKMGKGYLKIVAAMAAAGAIVAGVVAFRAPGKYVSTAVVRLAPRELGPIDRKFSSRTFLYTIANDSRLKLERNPRITMDETIQGLRQDLKIGTTGDGDLTISFAYPDKAKARDVVERVAAEAVSEGALVDYEHASLWEDLWPRDPAPTPSSPAHFVTPASVAQRAPGPRRLMFIVVGLGAGLALGVLVAFAVRRPRRTFALAGFALGGALVAIPVAFAIPDVYTSTATVQLIPPMFTERPSGAALAASMDERFRRAQQAALSQTSLAAIVQDPRIDLYKSERAREPLEKVLETMRARDLVIRPLNGAVASPDLVPGLSISFTYPDRYKSKKVVERIVTRLVNTHYQDAERTMESVKAGDETRDLLERHLGDELEVLDPASLPQVPIAPNRLIFLAGGMCLGVLAGWLLLARRSAATAGGLAV